MTSHQQHEINALKIHQWLIDWDEVKFDGSEHRRKPEPHFYVFVISARDLRKLSNVYQRKANKPRSQDTASQRSLEIERSEEISRYVKGGYPWSTLSDKRKGTTEYEDLRMPGWLPTAIIANILAPDALRGDINILEEDLIRIQDNDNYSAKLVLPEGYKDQDWKPLVAPIEIIDGQHRIYSFNLGADIPDDYELPVVAFYNLDFTWQAYLFYTINIKPKKINTSLAYDLYPLLRIQEWLEKSPDGPAIYRETRAQELTEALWAHPLSPWKDRINMLGEVKTGGVTQAAFIRALTVSLIKKGTTIGGLFGAELHKKKNDVLPWGRIRQAAFIITIWRCLAHEIEISNEEWAQELRSLKQQKTFETIIPEKDAAFYGQYSLLATDQGVRGFLQTINDMCFIAASRIRLMDWNVPGLIEDEFNLENITSAIESLENEPAITFVKLVCKELTKFDWRTSSTPNLNNAKRLSHMVFKGSSGYRELRNQLIELLAESKEEIIFETAKQLIKN